MWSRNNDVAEVSFTAFTFRGKYEQIPGCLVVRPIQELSRIIDQPTLLRHETVACLLQRSTLATATATHPRRRHH